MKDLISGKYDTFYYTNEPELAFQEGYIEVNINMIHSIYFKFQDSLIHDPSEIVPKIYNLTIVAEMEDYLKHIFYIRPYETENRKNLEWPSLDTYSPKTKEEETKPTSITKMLENKLLQQSYILLLLHFITNIQTEALKKKEKITRIRNKKNKESTTANSQENTNNTTYQNQIIHLGKGIRYEYEPQEESDTKEKRKYNKHCESWEVRGHYRHYKNGKVIFIKGYPKGKGKTKTTTYIIDQPSTTN